MRHLGLGLALAGCTPGEEGDAYVLAGERPGAVRADGAPLDPAFPVAVAQGTAIETDRDRFEAGPDEVILVRSEALDAYVVGVDVEAGLVAANGPEERVQALAEELDVDLERSVDGWFLVDPDIWPILASAPAAARVTLRPVSADDLPGTAALGGAVPHVPASPLAPPSWLPRLRTQGLANPDAGQGHADVLFDLEPGTPTLPLDDDEVARWVGRYCRGTESITLGASGVATVCAAGDCAEAAWVVDDGALRVDGSPFDVVENGLGYVLAGRVELEDIVTGGCP